MDATHDAHGLREIRPLGQARLGYRGGVRLVCRECRRLRTVPIKEMGRESLPRCCGAELLIAGEPKLDVHGLSGCKGATIDPAGAQARVPSRQVAGIRGWPSRDSGAFALAATA